MPLLPRSLARRCMRFGCFLSLFLFLGKTTAQNIFTQKVSISVASVTIPEALDALSSTTSVQFAYSERFFPENKKVSLQEKGRPLREVLDLLLKDTHVGYKAIDGQVVFFQLPKKQLRDFTLSGYVEDATSGERLIAAAIYCPELGIGTITNEYGFYSLTLPESATAITVSYLGYREETKALHLTQNQFTTYSLTPSLTLAEIIVTPENATNELVPSPANGINLPPDDFQAAPDLGGESDLMRIAQLLPGVQTGADGFGGLHIRGGNSDQNLVLLDGVPVYNPDHLLGIFSVFNTSAVKSAKLLRGSFPARYGGRVSSVFDVRTREGSTRSWGGGAALDLISGKAFLEGPFANNKGSIFLTGRMTHSDFLLSELGRKAFFEFEDASNNYEFYDFNAKVSYQFSDKDRVFLSFYRGNDFFSGNLETSVTDTFDFSEINFREKTNIELSWGNIIASLRWNHVFSPKLFANTTLTYSRYQFSSENLFTFSPEEEGEEDGLEFFEYTFSGSNIRDLALRTDFTYALNARHHLRFGGGFINHRFIPSNFAVNSGITEFDEIDSLEFSDFDDFSDVFTIHADEADLYVEDEFKAGARWQFNIGLRLSAFLSDRNFFNVEPRLIGSYQLTQKTALTASVTRNVQYLHRLFFNEINLPEDVWFPAYEGLEPQQSWQTTLGVEKKLPDGWQVSVEGYFKKMKNLYVFDPNNLQGELLNQRGYGYGTEFFIQKTAGKTGGWISYTLSRSDREFTDNFNRERQITAAYDRRHDLKIFICHRLNRRWQVSMNWVYGTPLPQLYAPQSTPRLLIEIDEPDNTPEPSAFHYRPTIRSRPYHRLDFALSYSLKRKKSEHSFKVSMYNVYSRRNPAFYRLSYQPGSQSFRSREVSLLPAMPGVYYGIKF